MDKKSDASDFISATVGGHPGSIYSANQTDAVDRLKGLLASKADVAFIGERALSRRKARKLANRYRGSSRGARYADYLLGNAGAYFVDGNRLVKTPKIGTARITTLHSADVVEVLAALRAAS